MNAINACARMIASRPELSHVELIKARADETELLPAGPFDLVVLNSVVQYFPNDAYLQKVLSLLASRLAPEGCIFVGDVRHLGLLPHFHRRLAASKQGEEASQTALLHAAERSAEQEEELVLDPGWFHQLAAQEDWLGSVSVEPRLDHYPTEMRLYRYDVTLSRRSLPDCSKSVVWFDYTALSDNAEAAIDAQLRRHAQQAVGIRQIPDPPVYSACGLWSENTPSHAPEEPSFQPLDLGIIQSLAERHRRRVEVTLSPVLGHLTVVFRPEAASDGCWLPPYPIPTDGRLCNQPDKNLILGPLIGSIRDRLRRTLPAHMVPSGFVGLSRLPLTPSGKVDRKALPDVEASLQRAAYEAPRSDAERAVAAAIGSVLGVADAGRHDSFFDLGGHSLLAVRLVARLEAETGKAVPVRAVFEAPTVAGLAAALGDPQSNEYRPLLHFTGQADATSARGKTPRDRLYCVHPASGHTTMFGQFAAPLAHEAEIIGVQSRGLIAGETSFGSYADMVGTYASAIDADAPDQARVLLGWSLGGYVAHDVACRLSEAGQRVGGVIILDSVEHQVLAAGRELQASLDRVRDFGSWLVEMAKWFYPDAAIEAAEGLEAQMRLLAQEAVRSGELADAEISDDPRLVEHLLRVWHGNGLLLEQRPASRRFAGPALVIRAADTRSRVEDPALGWSRYCASIDCHDVPFRHAELMQPEPAAMIAAIVRQWLRRRVGSLAVADHDADDLSVGRPAGAGRKDTAAQ